MQTRHVVGLAVGTLLTLGASTAVVIGALSSAFGGSVSPGDQSSPGASPPASVPTASRSPSGAGTVPDSTPGASGTRAGPSQAPNPDFGFIVGLADTAPGEPQTLVFDRATLLTGDAAAAEAASRGEEAFDYYIVNDNPRLRELEVGERNLVVHGSWFLTGQAEPTEIEPGDLFHYFLHPQAEKLPVELRYDAEGRVVSVTEIYFP